MRNMFNLQNENDLEDELFYDCVSLMDSIYLWQKLKVGVDFVDSPFEWDSRFIVAIGIDTTSEEYACILPLILSGCKIHGKSPCHPDSIFGEIAYNSVHSAQGRLEDKAVEWVAKNIGEDKADELYEYVTSDE